MKCIVWGVSPLRPVGKNGAELIEFHVFAPLEWMDKKNNFSGQKMKIVSVWNPGSEGGCYVEGDLNKLPAIPFELDYEFHTYNNHEYVDAIKIGSHVNKQIV